MRERDTRVKVLSYLPIPITYISYDEKFQLGEKSGVLFDHEILRTSRQLIGYKGYFATRVNVRIIA